MEPTQTGERERETDALTSAAADFDFCFSTVVVVVASMMFSSVLSSLSSPAAAAVRLGMIHDERRVEGRQDSRQDGDQFGCLLSLQSSLCSAATSNELGERSAQGKFPGTVHLRRREMFLGRKVSGQFSILPWEF